MSKRLSRRELIKAAGCAGIIVLGGGIGVFAPRFAQALEPTRTDAIDKISRVAMSSEIAAYEWADRGKSPAGYIKGMAVSFARVYHGLVTGDEYAKEMAKAMSAESSKDALKHYEDVFKQAGLDNSKDGVDTLRHLFVLMLGLGMRESSGRYCEGRDRAAHNTKAETAEAGLFQTSYNARSANPLMPKLFKSFMADPSPSYLDVFKEGVRARDKDLENFGEGEGRDFQKLSKECPFFALQFAAIGLRNIRKHWGPINRRAAEVKVEADAMFKEVQTLVDREKLGPLL